MRKLKALLFMSVLLSSLSCQSDLNEDVSSNESKETKIAYTIDGKTATMTYNSKNEVIKDDQFYSLKDYLEKTTTVDYLQFAGSKEVQLRTKMAAQKPAAKGVISRVCSGWYKLYDKDGNLLLERHLSEGYQYTDDIGLINNENLALKNTYFIQASNCMLYLTAAKFSGLPRNKWTFDINVSQIIDSRQQTGYYFLVPGASMNGHFVPAGQLFSVKGTYNCYVSA
ncbi:hypothetical protein B0A69_16185 [Chryseobacterium shigense]|uniref:DUF4595 domain-containing protein n=1 Tax=Chryseobacterium shigense TaxID=297244 RepID=A0A1N7HWJ2_9FLAO|nr:hypothetical protein [Chryseobacterium shigense]PQA91960.1 hypothetical protein B0A69_16185 [Chryseobacterium shigense]SIS29098.1 hypothetical protein SAMN05421639_101360 [Chryseobacterium shigense]